MKFFSQVTYDSQNLRHKTLVIADYDWVKIASLIVLQIRLLLNEDGNLHTDHLRYSF